MVDLETRHLKEEVRSTLIKKFQVRHNHLGHLNKRINDNLRELQLMDLRHTKELFELEMVCFEEIESKKNFHVNQLAELKFRHSNELQKEKESVISKKESSKEALLQRQHTKELKRLLTDHRVELKQVKLKQSNMVNTASKNGSKIASRMASAMGSKGHSRMGSNDSLASVQEDAATKKISMNMLNQAITEDTNDDNDVEETVDMHKISASLVALQRRHREELIMLEASIRKEIADFRLAFDVKFSDLEEFHCDSRVKLLADQERELGVMREAQEKEIKIEEMMHDSEMKMLIERRILNSVLETVADGIQFLSFRYHQYYNYRCYYKIQSCCRSHVCL